MVDIGRAGYTRAFLLIRKDADLEQAFYNQCKGPLLFYKLIFTSFIVKLVYKI